MNPLLLDVLARERLADRARQLEHHTRLQAARAAQAQARAAAAQAQVRAPQAHVQTPALGAGNVPTASRRPRPQPRPLGPLGVPIARLLRALAARLEPTPLVVTPTRTDHVRISLYARR